MGAKRQDAVFKWIVLFIFQSEIDKNCYFLGDGRKLLQMKKSE